MFTVEHRLQCEETFEGGSEGYRYSDDGNPQGAVYDESACTDESSTVTDTGSVTLVIQQTTVYTDDWANETMTIPDIDLTSMSVTYPELRILR